MGKALGIGAALLLAACGRTTIPPTRDAAGFPLPDRPVAGIVSAAWSNEADRERAGESMAVIGAAGVRPGMTVADIGAGEGYYTLALSKAVGAQGKVFAEDIVPSYVSALRRRLRDARIENVELIQGAPDDAKLPAGHFDRIFLVHMYHEISQPYGLLWRLRPALKPGGRIVIVDADRPTARHGTPPRLLACELATAGYRSVDRRDMPEAGGYLAMFEAAGEAPAPATIRPCRP
ncbi:methyltransferase domain-containing protein [Sphingomonas sp. BIUV-7]|uniref:Methyltransferase domain-containing protein n=1 Tax=Sphingomonas natans TaxID=3063330 RepID=A0ABT8Y7F0_9SPHN|nr:methyltransferase domain-containing protein [Sphingomonas sp. BIUV-7]MDO6413625.1 methyltransferase domain-containing protein [Sphingomonas sp. BIUV-7]